MTTREVNLVIRARDEAKKTLQDITAALNEFNSSQDAITKDAGKAGGLIGRLGEEYAKLNRELQGLSILSRVSADLSAANAAFDRNRSSVQRMKQELAGVAAEYGKIAPATRRLKDESDRAAAAVDAQRLALERNRTALKEAQAAVKGVRGADRSGIDALKRQIAEQREELGKLTKVSREANAAYDASKTRQDALQQSYQRTAASIERQSRELAQTGGSLARASAAATDLGQDIGTATLDQRELGEASRRTAADIEKVTAALKKQESALQPTVSAGPAAQATAAYRAQVQAVRDAQQAWRSAQAEANRLAQTMRNTAQPTREMQTSFALAQATSRAAKQEYYELATALNQVRGTTQGTFAAFQQHIGQMQTVTQVTERATRQQFQLLPGLRSTFNAVRSGAAPAAQSVSAFGNAFQIFNRGGREALSLGQRIRGEVLSLTASYVGLYAAITQISETVRAFQTLEAVQSRLGVVFEQDFGRVATEVSWLRSEAIRLGISFEVLGDTYSKFAVATKVAGFELEATRYIFTSVAEAARVNKVSVDQLRGTFLALEQMISKGKVQSEELRRQLGDRMAGAFSMFATGLKMTTQELDAALKAGEIFSTDTTMLAFADELNRKFGNQLPTALESLTTQLARFQALVFDFRIKVAQAGFADELRDGITEVNEALQSVGGEEFAKTIGRTLGTLASGIALVVEHFGALITVAKLFISIKLAQAMGALIVSIQASAKTLPTVSAALAQVTAAATSVRASFAGLTLQMAATRAAAAGLAVGLGTLRAAATTLAVAFRALWVAIGGLPGLILTGVAFVLTGVLGDWIAGVDGATQALDEHDRVLTKVRDSYAAAKGDVANWSDEVKKANRDELTINTRRLEAQLKELREGAAEPWLSFGYAAAHAAKAFRILKKEFREGRIDAKEFRDEINAIAAADPNLDDTIVRDLQELADKAVEVEEKLAENVAVLDLIDGKATEAGAAVLGLAETGGAVSREFGKAEEALKKIEGMIPGFADELKALDEAANFDQWVKDILALGPATEETMQKIARARQGLADAAVDSSIKGGLVDKIIGIESGGDPSAKNPLSSATGLGQFIESTWLDMFQRYFPDRAATMSREAILALRTEAALSRQMIELYAAENTKLLQQAGVRFDETAQYLAHFLGPQGAIAVLSANANTAVTDILGSDAVNANPGILGGGASAGDVIAWAERKIGISERELELQTTLRDIESDRAKEAQKYLDTREQALADHTFEMSVMNEQKREQAILTELRNQENAAKEAGIAYSKEMAAADRKRAGEAWDAANRERLAAEEKKRVDEAANILLERRRMLMEQIQFYESQGNQGAADQLRVTLEQTDVALQQAIQSAIAFWQAAGGPEADNAILKYQRLLQEISITKERFEITADSINDNIVNGMSSAFDNFAQKVAEGAKVWDSLKTAFLQFASDFLRQIAQMIIQKAIFNAIGGSGATGGGGLGGAIAGAISGLFKFHEGGVVGSSGTPYGRPVAPAWFNNAIRYHSGGIAGLRPGEVPAILKRGEEVLTESDPRHIGNSGGATPTPANVRVVNTFDSGSFLSEALNTTVGEQVILNFLRANSGAVRQIIGS